MGVSDIVQDIRDLFRLLAQIGTLYDTLEENRDTLTQEQWQDIDQSVQAVFEEVQAALNELLASGVLTQEEATRFTENLEDAMSNYGKGGSACEGQGPDCNEPLYASETTLTAVVNDLEAKQQAVFLEEAQRILNAPEAEEGFWDFIEMLQAVYAFFEQCRQENWASYKNQGLVPYCFWRDAPMIATEPYGDIAFVSGLIDGLYQEGEGLVKLPEVVQKMTAGIRQLVYAYSIGYLNCHQNKVKATKERLDYLLEHVEVAEPKRGFWNWMRGGSPANDKEAMETYLKTCEEVMQLRREVAELYELVNSWEDLQQRYRDIKSIWDAYWETLGGNDNIASYEGGKLFIFVASGLVPGVGQLSKAKRVTAILEELKGFTKTQWDELVARVRSGFGGVGNLGKIGDNLINSVAGDIKKFSEYALTNPSKTGLFVDSWGYKLSDAESLLSIYKNQAVQAVKDGKVIFSKTTQFGIEYKIETILNTPLKGEIKIYSGWIIKNDKIDELLLSSPFVDWVK